MSKDSIFPIRESAFHSIYQVSGSNPSDLLKTLDHIKLKGETPILMSEAGQWYTIVASKP